MPSYTRTVREQTFISNDRNISGKDFRPEFPLVQIMVAYHKIPIFVYYCYYYGHW